MRKVIRSFTIPALVLVLAGALLVACGAPAEGPEAA